MTVALQLLKGVEGEASATDRQVAVADGTTGKKIAFSSVTIDGSGNMAVLGKLTVKDSGNILTNKWTAEFHADDENVYMAGFFNDTYSTTVPVFEYYGWNSGLFSMGTPAAYDFNLYAGGYTHPSVRLNATNQNTTFFKDAAPTTITKADMYTILGDDEYALNSYRLMGFGYNITALTHVPAFIGFQCKSVAGNTKGDLVFGTRDVTTDTAPTIRMRLVAGGSLLFIGDGSGIVYGSCYGNHIGWAANGGAGAVQNTWYNISDADMTDGELNLVTHDGSGLLTVLEPGRYKITYTICLEVNAANAHIETGIEISSSGSADAKGQAHVENKFANEEEHIGGSNIFDLADNATIEVAIRHTDAATPVISVQSVNIVITQVGGT